MGIADGSVNLDSFGTAEAFTSESDGSPGVGAFFRFEREAASLEHSPEKLSPEERIIADRILADAVKNIQELSNGRHFLTAMLVKKIIGRLLEKLQESALPETAVGAIAEGVWTELNMASGLMKSSTGGGTVLKESASSAEQKIVQDILRRLNGKFFRIKSLWKDVVQAVGPQASSKIIRVVAMEIWPEMKGKMGY